MLFCWSVLFACLFLRQSNTLVKTETIGGIAMKLISHFIFAFGLVIDMFLFPESHFLQYYTKCNIVRSAMWCKILHKSFFMCKKNYVKVKSVLNVAQLTPLGSLKRIHHQLTSWSWEVLARQTKMSWKEKPSDRWGLSKPSASSLIPWTVFGGFGLSDVAYLMNKEITCCYPSSLSLFYSHSSV